MKSLPISDEVPRPRREMNLEQLRIVTAEVRAASLDSWQGWALMCNALSWAKDRHDARSTSQQHPRLAPSAE